MCVKTLLVLILALLSPSELLSRLALSGANRMAFRLEGGVAVAQAAAQKSKVWTPHTYTHTHIDAHPYIHTQTPFHIKIHNRLKL